MKKILGVGILSIGLIVTSCKRNDVVEHQKNNIQVDTLISFKKALLKTQFDSIISKYNFNGNVGVYQDSLTLYEKNNGFENFNTKKPLSEQSVFAIASISKQFTSVMIMKLHEEQKLKITDSVFHFIPEFKEGGLKNIIVAQLMNHTSGIVDEGDGLATQPGKEFHYSNKGYFYLGKIIEKASGKSFDEYAGSLFSKLGLKNTFTSTNYKGNNLASAYVGTLKNNEEIPDMPNRLSNKNISNPAGGILSTVRDLHIWNQKLYGGQIISKSSLEQVLHQSAERKHPIFGKMGYGYGIMMGISAPKNYFHSGYIKGGPSLNVYYPKTKTSLIILSNIADESIGKNAIFKPHKEMKQFTDLIENASL